MEIGNSKGTLRSLQGNFSTRRTLKELKALGHSGTRRGQGVGGHYVWYLVIVVIFMGLGGAKRWGVKSRKMRRQFS